MRSVRRTGGGGLAVNPLIRRASALVLAFSAGGLAAGGLAVGAAQAGPVARVARAVAARTAVTRGLAGGSVSWRTAWRGPRDGAVLAITAPSKKSAWAIGATYGRKGRPFLLRWNGRRWHESGMPVRGYQPYAIASSSADDVWMFGVTAGRTPEALSWNGHQWISVPEPAGADAALTGVAVLGPANVWIGMQGTVFHDLGGIWTTSHLPGIPYFGELGGTSDRNMWAVGTTGDTQSSGRVVAYRWTGGTWRPVKMPHPPGYDVNILAESRKNVWIVANDRILHWNGSRWSERSNANEPMVGPLAPFNAKGLWVSAYDLWTGSSWITVLPNLNPDTPVFDNALAHIPGTHQTWLAGDSGLGAIIMKSVG
jgi:hypothetical protein